MSLYDYFIGLSDHVEPIISDEDAKLLKAYHASSDKERKTIDYILEEYKTEEKAIDEADVFDRDWQQPISKATRGTMTAVQTRGRQKH